MKHSLTLNVRDVLSFLDELSSASRGHVSAIVSVVGEDLGIALLRRCLSEQHGIASTVIMNNGVPTTPTNGTGRGNRLDRWLLANATPKQKRALYQVEIKNWSATAIGGRELRLDAEDAALKEYRRERWLTHWNTDQECLRFPIVGKVLNRMSIPTHMDDESGHSVTIITQLQQPDVKPMVCFWWGVHIEDKMATMFLFELSSFVSDHTC